MNSPIKNISLTVCLLFLPIVGQEQPRTPRGEIAHGPGKESKPTPSRDVNQLIQAINIQDFSKVRSLLKVLPSYRLAKDFNELIYRSMKPTNIFYSKDNFDKAFLEPYNREYVKQFAHIIMYQGQGSNRSEESQHYYNQAEKRFLSPEEIALVSAINTQNYTPAIKLIAASSSPIAHDLHDLINKTMARNNMFYSKKNFDRTDVEPFDRDNIKQFAHIIMHEGQSIYRSQDSYIYYNQAEKRFLSPEERALVKAINTQDYMHAIELLPFSTSPISLDLQDLINRNMLENNIFYSKDNFDNTNVEPFDRDNIKQLAHTIMYKGQGSNRSEESQLYYNEAEKRFLSPKETALLKAINTQEYMNAIELVPFSTSPISLDIQDLMNRTMLKNNIFYSKDNFDNTNVEPFNRKHLMRFARGIIQSGQKKGRSEDSRSYYAQVEQRFLP